MTCCGAQGDMRCEGAGGVKSAVWRDVWRLKLYGLRELERRVDSVDGITVV